ncbi:transposase [Streptomyces sp. MBT53]|uniref:transposase n=1 Tax=Streptomyces sp. MBT53 TaxID=1488384 RepID=UPI001F2FDC7E|nr:transposase [Streptomyces sp. MBT53]
MLPRDRNKTLTCLAGTGPVVGAQHAAAQRLQFFLSESTWDGEQVNARRLKLLLADPATAPHDGGVLVIDDSGDRKDGSATAHVGKQYLGSVGKIDRGVVTVTTCWADERLYYPLHAMPYTPASSGLLPRRLVSTPSSLRFVRCRRPVCGGGAAGRVDGCGGSPIAGLVWWRAGLRCCGGRRGGGAGRWGWPRR